ncbi:MAG: cupin domain-containing protein [Lachnospiraceae bacterium]|jgi:mannose-6-phosphate isomerase-like protein (cupin superfamily)|nr:cupin domain-containing protein [Lachnospiraceae bacterium]
MIINFDNMEEKCLPEFKGGKGEMIAKMHTDEMGKILYGKLKPGDSIGYHKHETSSEIIYILSGRADFLYDEGKEAIEAGGCHYCPKGHSHSMLNNSHEDLIFFAVVPEQ